MEVTQRFTERGKWGAALFVLGPILFAISWYLIGSDGVYGRFERSAGYIPLAAASLIATLIGIPLMLTGREYSVTITYIPRDSIK